ncbi:MAG TPA: hypothetical protein PK369_04295 [Thermoclostridium sp.]|nr:hypothetical protein [Clostridiaceae bacterium]HOQ75776.1 hypothetical protein [Thermoclostridium sp.]HPU45445.1 hypothetical protein [Thermoclostridium sp.]
MSVMVYKCPQCGASLTFNADVQRWDCKFCLGSFDIATLEKRRAEEAEKEKEFAEQAEPEAEVETGQEEIKVDEEFNRNARAYRCPDCGAEIVTDATTAATFCVFCHNPTIIPARLSGEYRPSRVIPFKISKEAAQKAFINWCRKKPLVPSGFKSKPQMEKITGMYLPFWLHDCSVSGTLRANAQKIRKWRSGKYEYTETSYFEIFREGDMRFTGVPADGSSKMDDNMMDLLEPYDYSQMVDFSMSYLSGYLAEKYDVDKETVWPRIKDRVAEDTVTQLMLTARGYDAIQVTHKEVRIKNKLVHYTLLPVWMLIYKHKDKKYLFAMNGQTGKVVGNLPISIGRVIAWFSGIAAAVFTALFLIGGVLM